VKLEQREGKKDRERRIKGERILRRKEEKGKEINLIIISLILQTFMFLLALLQPLRLNIAAPYLLLIFSPRGCAQNIVTTTEK
jgi:hypothetical protein